MDLPHLATFVATFAMVSLTPGLCMTLALSLGMAVGLPRTLWMMIGELLAVGVGTVITGAGLATVLLAYPALFTTFKWLGGAYLVYLGVQMWRARGAAAIDTNGARHAGLSRLALATQGFVTAIANPKGWAFLVALLPPFLDPQRPLAPQLGLLVAIILVIEFGALLLYAGGGHGLRRLVADPTAIRRLNRVAGTLLMAVGVWLALD